MTLWHETIKTKRKKTECRFREGKGERKDNSSDHDHCFGCFLIGSINDNREWFMFGKPMDVKYNNAVRKMEKCGHMAWVEYTMYEN